MEQINAPLKSKALSLAGLYPSQWGPYQSGRIWQDCYKNVIKQFVETKVDIIEAGFCGTKHMTRIQHTIMVGDSAH